MIQVEIEPQFAKFLDEDRLARAAQITLAQHAGQSGDLALVVRGDAALQQLNRDYLGVDQPTDVLAFPSHELDPDTGLRYLGDVIISFPMAQAQALLAGHSAVEEIDLLVVHGVLHLLGYDHDTEDRRTQMWAVQERMLHLLQDGI